MEERDRDLDRLLTFVDAIVAIAITLLVLPLAEVGRELGGNGTAALLREHAVDVLGFVLSFVVIARLWVAQHRIVRTLVRQSGLIVWLLLAWSFTIVFLPFPTSLAAGTTNDPLAKTLYIGTMAVSSLLLAVLARTIGRKRELRDSDRPPDSWQATATAAAFALALAITLVAPATSYWPLLALLLADPVVNLVRRRQSSGDSPSGLPSVK